jgi:hypothetical protein
VDNLLGIYAGIVQLLAAKEEPCHIFWGRLLVVREDLLQRGVSLDQIHSQHHQG